MDPELVTQNLSEWGATWELGYNPDGSRQQRSCTSSARWLGSLDGSPRRQVMHNPHYPPTEDRSSTPYPGGYPNPAAVELTVEPDGGGALDGPSGGPPPGFDCSRLIRNSVHQASPPRIRTAVHRQFVVATTPRGRDGWTGPPVTHTDYVTLARTGSGWRFAAYMTTGRAAWS